MAAYDRDPDDYVRENRETLVRILKHGNDVFVRALVVAALMEYGGAPDLEDVEREIKKARDGENEDR